MPDDARWIDPVLVPDDLRELQADVEAYHREQRLAARRRRMARLTGGRRFRDVLLPIGVVTAALGLAAVVFAILTLGQPRVDPAPAQAPLATAPTGAVGEVHGLLPDVTVRTASGQLSVRDLRPALFVLVPAPCRCTELLGRLASQADEVPVPLVVVAPTAQDAELDALAGQLHRGHVEPVFDRAGELARAYATDGVTTLVVGPDGTVRHIADNVTSDVRLELYLQGLRLPVAAHRG